MAISLKEYLGQFPRARNVVVFRRSKCILVARNLTQISLELQTFSLKPEDMVIHFSATDEAQPHFVRGNKFIPVQRNGVLNNKARETLTFLEKSGKDHLFEIPE